METQRNATRDAKRLAFRQAIYAWVRDDCPLAIKLTIMPEHCDKLSDRIIAVAETN